MSSITRVICGAYAENAYILDNGLIIDPGDDIDAIKAAARAPKAILLTHGHFDHMLAAEKLQDEFGVDVYVHQDDAEMLSDAAKCFYAAEVSSLPMPSHIQWKPYGNEIFGLKVIATPGHSRGSVCLYDEVNKQLFSGDTLFRAGFGRTDLYGGSGSALRNSLINLLMLPGDTIVYPGHGESTTIETERRRYGR